MKNIVGYKRVSSAEQVEGTSLEVQEDQIRKWVALYKADHEVTHIYSDEGESGGSLDRPALQQLLQDAADGKFEAVVFTKLDRLARSMKGLLEIWEKLEKANININCVQQNIDTTKPEGRLMRNMLGVIAEFERDTIRDRCMSGLNSRWRKGAVIGELPLGYRKGKDGRAAIDPEGALLYKRIVDMYLNEHLPMRDIADRLDAENVPTPFDRKNKKRKKTVYWKKSVSHWNSIFISKTLRNPAYVGEAVRLNKRKHEERITTFYPPLISKARWDKIQTRINQQTHKPKRSWKGYEASFWLDGFLFCGLCGGKVRKRVQHRGGKDLMRYVCHWRHIGPRQCKLHHRDYCTMRQVDSNEVDRQVFEEAISILASPGKYAKRWLAELGTRDLKKQIKSFDNERRSLREELDRGLTRIKKAKTASLLEFYSAEQDKTEQAMSEIESQLAKLREEQEILAGKGDRFKAFKEALQLRGGYFSAKRAFREVLLALPAREKKKIIEAMISPWDGGRVTLQMTNPEDMLDDPDYPDPEFTLVSDFRVDLNKIQTIIAGLDRSALEKADMTRPLLPRGLTEEPQPVKKGKKGKKGSGGSGGSNLPPAKTRF